MMIMKYYIFWIKSSKVSIVSFVVFFLEIPDILNAGQCLLLRNWDGDAKFLPNFKFRRFGQKHLDEKLKKVQRSETVEKPMDCEDSEWKIQIIAFVNLYIL